MQSNRLTLKIFFKWSLRSSGRSSFDAVLSFTGRATGVQRGGDEHDGRPIRGWLSQRGGAGQPSASAFTTTHRPRLSDGRRDTGASCQGRTSYTQRGRVPGKIINDPLWMARALVCTPSKEVRRIKNTTGLRKSSSLFKDTNKTIQDVYVDNVRAHERRKPTLLSASSNIDKHWTNKLCLKWHLVDVQREMKQQSLKVRL